MNIYKNQSVFITGDTGFKGSWMAIWLMQLGAKITGYALPPEEKGNFTACGLGKRFRHIDGDISDAHLLEKTMRACRPVIAFHLAAQPLVIESYRAPVYTFNTNTMGTARFLEAARSCKTLKAAVVVTTDKVYENPEDKKPFAENDPLGGHDPYSASKAGAEIVVQSYSRSFFDKGRVAIASARSGNVIGGGDFALHRIVPDCIRALKQEKPVLVRNPGSIRPWQHVLEPMYGYLLLGAALASKVRKYSGAWNFGPLPGQARSVRELVQTVIKEWGSGKLRVSKGAGPHEAKYLKLNSGKAKRMLKWRPVLGFKETVKQTVSEYKEMDRLDPEEVFLSRIGTIKKYMERQCPHPPAPSPI